MEHIFLRILNMSITAGYCILIVVILRQLLRRAPKRYSYVLWSVVYFRMACPVSFKSMLSLIRVNPQTVPQDIGIQEMPRIVSGAKSVDAVVTYGVSQAVPQAKPGSGINPMDRILFAAGIYLPSGLEGGSREAVLEHERTHIRRRDYLIKPAAYLLTCIHWFNPLAWLAFQLLCRDMEMSCDESAIQRMGGEKKKEYSAALLSLAMGQRTVNGSSLAFGEGVVRKRIANILSYRRPAFWADIFLAGFLTVVLIGLALDPKMEVLGAKSGRMPTISVDAPESAGWQEMSADGLDAGDISDAAYAESRPGYSDAALHLYFPAYALESEYVDTEWLTQEEGEALAQQAIRELYDMTGTQIEECFYYYDTWGSFSFGLTEDDMEHQRFFLMRTYGENENSKMEAIATVYVSSARRTWFSPVYQYNLPADYETMTDVERAVWFLKRSGQYNGQPVRECFRPYEGMPETWRIVMEDDTAYEITLDSEIDSFYDIAGPYPDSDIRH